MSLLDKQRAIQENQALTLSNEEAAYTDLFIFEDDLTLDESGFPLLISDRYVIAQDIKHMIRERGYLVQIIAERDRPSIQRVINKIIIDIENDERIIPGSVFVERRDRKRLYIFAQTNLGQVSVEL